MAHSVPFITRLEDTARKQIASIPALAEDAAVRLFGDAGCAAESSPDTKVMSVIRTVVSRAATMAFQSSAFQTAVKRAVQKFMTKPHVVNDVATRTIDARAFTVPVVKFVKNEIAKRSLEKDEMDQYRNVSNKVVVSHKTKAEDEFPPQRMDSVRSPNRPTDISDGKKTNMNAYSTFTSLD